MIHTAKSKIATGIAALILSPLALAQVTVSDAWVRGTVPAQKVTGAFMQLKSDKAIALVGAESPAAAVVEIHEMRMEGDMARMRQLPRIDLPVGQVLSLQPGGYHLMLMGLKRPLNAGERIPLKLRFQSAATGTHDIEVQAEVRSLNSAH